MEINPIDVGVTQSSSSSENLNLSRNYSKDQTESLVLPEQYKKYFEKQKDNLMTTLVMAEGTQYGQEVIPKNIPDWSEFSLEQYLSLPLLDASDLVKDPNRFKISTPEGTTLKLYTSGSSGIGKEVEHSSEKMVTDLDQTLIDIINNSDKPILLHGRARTTSYEVSERSFATLCSKPVETKTYRMPDEAVQQIIDSEADTIYFVGEVTSADMLMSGLKKMYDNKDPRVDALKGRRFLMEVVAEPLSLEQVKQWKEIIDDVFQMPLDPNLSSIVSVYALTEALKVGLYISNPGDKKIEYKVSDRQFVTVLDPSTGEPVVGKLGKIVTTTLRWGKDGNGTYLPKYNTGDMGIARFNNEGQMYISEVGRDPNKGTISFLGLKIAPKDIVKELDKLGIKVRLSAQKSVSPTHSLMDFTLYSSDFSDPEKTENAKQAMQSLMETVYKPLGNMQKNGYLKVRIHLDQNTPDALAKSWILLPEKNITDAEFEKS